MFISMVCAMKQLSNQLFKAKKYIKWLVLPLTIAILSFSVFSPPAWATGVYQMPSLTPKTWIVDEADVISRVNEGKISSALENLSQQTGNEVRFVTVRRLDYGETSQSFTKELFEKWFPTPDAQANQTLLMIDIITNNPAMITGNEVKSVMPDETAQSVADETLMVPLRSGNKYNQAFLDASDRLVAVLSGEPDPGPPVVTDNIQVEGTFTSAEETDDKNATVWVVGLLIAATVIPMATYFMYMVFQPSSNQ